MGVSKQKQLGQVFTPSKIVKYMCNMVGYHGQLDKTVFEPSFGDGAFLKEILSRMIEYGRTNEMSDTEIAECIDKCLYGNELDNSWYHKALEGLNSVLKKYDFKAECTFPNITNLDTLTLYRYHGKMDYVIGNPPYVRTSLLSDEVKEQIKNMFFTSGSTDLYIIFYEFCMNCLKEETDAHLIFITPRTFINSESCTALRRYLVRNNLITDLVDYYSNKVFDDADVYCAIMHLQTQKQSNQMGYYNGESDMTPKLPYCVVDLSAYDDTKASEPWDFAAEAVDGAKDVTLNDLCTIVSGCDVLKNDVFLYEHYFTNADYVLFNGFMIEKELIKPVLKGSAFTGLDDINAMFFPYEFNDVTGKYELISEDVMKAQYPKGYRYLMYYKDCIDSKYISWYANTLEMDSIKFKASEGYGRYIFKHIISPTQNKVELHKLNDGLGVFSGFILEIEDSKYDFVKSIIESEDFIRYLRGISRVMSGGYYVARMTSIKNYKACSYEDWNKIMNGGVSDETT